VAGCGAARCRPVPPGVGGGAGRAGQGRNGQEPRRTHVLDAGAGSWTLVSARGSRRAHGREPVRAQQHRTVREQLANLREQPC